MSAATVLLGGGGHARVLLEILRRQGMGVLGLTDRVRPAVLPQGVAYLGGDEHVQGLDPETVRLVNGLGSTASTRQRRELFDRFVAAGFRFASIVHPSAVLSSCDLQLGHGIQVLAGAIVNPHCRIGDNVLINTRAVVEHDCVIGNHAHVATGAIVCGGCRIGAGVHIGAGATIIQGVAVGDGAIIAAGAVVIHDVKPMTLVAGVPATEKRSPHGH